MRRITFVIVLGLTLSVATNPLTAEDWPQWRGAERLAIWDETGIVDELPDALKVTWRVPIRGGYAGPAVAGGRARGIVRGAAVVIGTVVVVGAPFVDVVSHVVKPESVGPGRVGV